MPMGKGTYGNKVGRPKTKNKSMKMAAMKKPRKMGRTRKA